MKRDIGSDECQQMALEKKNCALNAINASWNTTCLFKAREELLKLVFDRQR